MHSTRKKNEHLKSDFNKHTMKDISHLTTLPIAAILLILNLAVLATSNESVSSSIETSDKDIDMLGSKKDMQHASSSSSGASSDTDQYTDSYKLIQSVAPLSGGSAYVGCFHSPKTSPPDSWIRSSVSHHRTDVTSCITDCWRSRRRFAILRANSHCMCTDLFSMSLRAEDSLCHLTCSNNATQLCGGPGGAVSVYFTGYIQEPEFTHVTDHQLSQLHRGCYRDASVSSLCRLTFSSPRLSLPMCLALCEDALYRHAAMDTATSCCCGDVTDGVDHVTDERKCSLGCPGSRDHHCGGGYRGLFSLYDTGVSDIVKAQHKPAKAPPSLQWLNPRVNYAAIKVRTP